MLVFRVIFEGREVVVFQFMCRHLETHYFGLLSLIVYQGVLLLCLLLCSLVLLPLEGAGSGVGSSGIFSLINLFLNNVNVDVVFEPCRF